MIGLTVIYTFLGQLADALVNCASGILSMLFSQEYFTNFTFYNTYQYDDNLGVMLQSDNIITPATSYMYNFMKAASVFSLINAIAVATFMFCLALTILSMFFAPANEKRATNPLALMIKIFVIIALMAAHIPLSNAYGSFVGTMFKTTGTAVFNQFSNIVINIDRVSKISHPIYYLLECALQIAAAIALLRGSITYLERYMTLIFSIYIGPIALSFGVGSETEDIPKQWALSIVSQTIGIMVSSVFLFMCIKALAM